MNLKLDPSWKRRRNDKRVENYWKRKEKEGELNSFEKYQQKYNFIEYEYADRLSNNNLDPMNPKFAFTTNLAKYILTK